MLQAFVFDKIAVLVFPWHEAIDPPERGARVEVRLLPDEPHRGSYAAAQRIVVDHPVFRADLFDQLTAPPGNLRSAHFHPHFDGVEPSDRVWPSALKQDPTAWLAAELSDLAGMLTRAGVDAATAAWVDKDAAELREVIPTIVAAVEVTWGTVRAASV